MSRADPGSVEVESEVRRRFQAEGGHHDPVERLSELLVDAAPLMSPAEVHRRARQLAGELIGLGPLQHLLDDPEVTDVLANGPGEVWVERRGVLQRTGVVVERQDIERAIERLVGPLGLRADRSSPLVDARLDDGTRVAAVLRPLAVDGPVLAVRRHLARALPLGELAEEDVAVLLRSLVAARENIVVFGATGAGKTTLVGALLGGVPSDERVVTIEDVAELQLAGDHVVRLEARPGTADGVGRTAVRDLVRAALRLRPDRLVVGEVRGAEAADMVWALSTGHRGGLSTCHAGSPQDLLARLETMCLLAGDGVPHRAVRAQVRSAVDVVVGVRRGPAGARRVESVHRVGPAGLSPALVDRGALVVPPVASTAVPTAAPTVVPT
ncbi:MAG: CpaF family protein [Microthrixaceae bacterium]